MQFDQRLSIDSVTTNRQMVTHNKAPLTTRGSSIPTLSYIGATDGKLFQRGMAGEVATASVSPALPSGLARR
jgi:hypothetical protein